MDYIKTANSFAFYKHFNTVIADDQAAYVASAYSWAAKFETHHHTRGYEAGFMVSGDEVANIRRELELPLPPADAILESHFRNLYK